MILSLKSTQTRWPTSKEHTFQFPWFTLIFEIYHNDLFFENKKSMQNSKPNITLGLQKLCGPASFELKNLKQFFKFHFPLLSPPLRLSLQSPLSLTNCEKRKNGNRLQRHRRWIRIRRRPALPVDSVTHNPSFSLLLWLTMPRVIEFLIFHVFGSPGRLKIRRKMYYLVEIPEKISTSFFMTVSQLASEMLGTKMTSDSSRSGFST